MSETTWIVLIACVACLWAYSLFGKRRKGYDSREKEMTPNRILVDEDKVEDVRRSVNTPNVIIIPVPEEIARKVRKEAASAKLCAVKTLKDSMLGVGLKEAKEYVDNLEFPTEKE